jgi:hypothetical protein
VYSSQGQIKSIISAPFVFTHKIRKGKSGILLILMKNEKTFDIPTETRYNFFTFIREAIETH